MKSNLIGVVTKFWRFNLQLCLFMATLTMHLHCFASAILCASIYQDAELVSDSNIKVVPVKQAQLKIWRENKEPVLRFMSNPQSYEPANKTIFDNRRGYYLPERLRFRSNKLIRMFRGLSLLPGEEFMPSSDQKGRPIWMAPDYEHARLYAAEWTNQGLAGARAVVIEMLIPQFMIYWKEDPRLEMAEAFILDTDIKTLDSFIVRIHKVNSTKPKRTEIFDDDFYRTSW